MLRATQTGKMACTPSENDLPHDVAAVLDDDALADLQNGPTSPEPGSAATDRQLPLLGDAPVSVVPYPQLVKLAETAIRVESRKVYVFDWDALVSDRPEWRFTEAVHRKAVQQARNGGLDVQPSDVPTDTVLMAVQSVIALWTQQPELRPTDDGFAQEQARRGEQGRESRQANTADRNVRIRALSAEGATDAEIARKVHIDRSTVGRILAKANATPPEALNAPPPAFPAPELPPAERWPVNRFTAATGSVLDAAGARWLADWGRCYESDGCASELIAAIEASAGAAVDPWAYLVQCIANRYDAWTVSPQLLADVLSWCGQPRLEYALTLIASGYVRRPIAYLRRTLANEVAQGKPAHQLDRPVALAVQLARRWAPALDIDGADDAIAAEDAVHRNGYISDYRRRHGRLPWEDPPPEPVAAPDCCNGLKGYGGDDVNYSELIDLGLTSSPPYPKAIATPEPEKVEQPAKPSICPDLASTAADRRPGAAQKSAQRPRSASGGAGGEPDLEHRPCRHPMAPMVALALDPAAAVKVDCVSTGCGCQVYSVQGPVACPCHWPAARVAAVRRALEAHAAA